MLLSWTLKYLPEIHMIMFVCCWMMLPVPIPCCLCPGRILFWCWWQHEYALLFMNSHIFQKSCCISMCVGHYYCLWLHDVVVIAWSKLGLFDVDYMKPYCINPRVFSKTRTFEAPLAELLFHWVWTNENISFLSTKRRVLISGTLIYQNAMRWPTFDH